MYVYKICSCFSSLIIFSVPPYGSEQDANMQSIFEIPHLQASRLFLSIQCTLSVVRLLYLRLT